MMYRISGGSNMRAVSFTEFRKNASSLLSEVEKGQTFLVTRHGRPIAEVTPATPTPHGGPSWKRPGLRLSTNGAGLSAAILEERDREDVL